MKLLTVIIPAYNMEALLPRCLESLPVEEEALDVLVVNDGSTDGTSRIAHSFADKHPAVIRVIDKPNGHYGSCINAALPVATGAYVKILDADDSVKTDAMRTLLAALREEHARAAPADAVISDWVSVNPDGEEIERYSYDFLPAEPISMAAFNRLREGKGLIGIHAICYRRAIFNRFTYHQTEGCCYTDTEWFSIPMAYAESIRYVPLCVTQYLVGRDGQSMDPKIFARDFHVLGTIAFNLIHTLQREPLSPAASEYLLSCCTDLLGLIYRCALFGFDGHTVSFDLTAFDSELNRTAPEIHAALNNLKMPSKRLTYFYIRDWRRRNSKCTLRFALFLIYRYTARLLLNTLRRKNPNPRLPKA